MAVPQLPRRFRPYAPGTQPAYLHEPYRSSLKRAPLQPQVLIPQTLSELTGPLAERIELAAVPCDMTKSVSGREAIGQRISVSGRVIDEDGRPVRGALMEIWQANAAGRYLHSRDQHDAPLDPNFAGVGQTLTDHNGSYRFITILPGNYPWGNHSNAWRPAHIHFSLFGPALATRLVTQMYFPGDPLLPFDPIYNCTADAAARERLISQFDWDTTVPDTFLGYRWDIVLRGRDETPMEEDDHSR